MKISTLFLSVLGIFIRCTSFAISSPINNPGDPWKLENVASSVAKNGDVIIEINNGLKQDEFNLAKNWSMLIQPQINPDLSQIKNS